jgi:NhaP-type Na+/H+ or K+/H+ antiporter
MVGFFYLTLVFALGDHALPGGILFSIGLTWVCAIFFGARAGNIGLPPLVGMLMAGFALGNLGFLSSGETWKAASGLGRNFALAIIMLRAGLGMDREVLVKKFGLMCIIGWIPASFEAVLNAWSATAVFGMDWKWAMLLGFTLCDVSPAVTTPLLLDFHLQGFGVKKGIPTILLAAGVHTSVYAIIMYSIMFTFVFSSGGEPIEITLLKGIGQVFLGTIVGGFTGWLLHLTWHHHTATPMLRSGATILSAPCLIYIGKTVDMSGGGTVAVIVTGIYLAAVLNPEDGLREVESVAASIWKLAGQPLLFGLLGSAVSLETLTPSMIGSAAGVIMIGLTGLVFMTYIVTLFTDFDFWERMFCCVATCPKATVQAALSTVALDYVMLNSNRPKFDDDGAANDFDLAEKNATIVLTTAVLSILMTAPTVAIAMKYAGENWLVKETNWKDGRPIGDDPDFDPDEEVAITINLGTRKDSLSSSLGDRKISLGGGEGPNGRKWSIQKSEVTPSGVAPRNRSLSNPATLKAMGLNSRGGAHNPLAP